MLPAAAVTTHAKPHAQQQLARDLEVERAASKVRRGAARQAATTSIAGFLMHFSSAAVETKSESEPPTSLSGNLCQVDALGKIWFAHARASMYAATPRFGPGLLCAAARFVSAMYVTVLVLSRIFRPHEYPLSAGRVRVHTSFEC